MKRLVRLPALAAALLSVHALAQESVGSYPSKPVVVIAGIATGGGIDIEGRLYLKKMTEFLGQPFVLDFKPGAAGTIGAGYVAKARPDGYTLLATTGGFTVFPAFYKDLSFDVMRDFAPISLMSERFSVLQVSQSFPAKTFPEYLAYVKANPGKVNFGTTGVGSITHLAGAWLHGATNTSVTFIPYKGNGPLMQELIAGRVDVSCGILTSSLPLVKAGKSRALAVLNDKQSRLFPGLKTVAEHGVTGYNYANWMGFLAPGATPAVLVNKLSDEFARTARSQEVVNVLESEGSIPVGSTPAQFRQLIALETARWQKVVLDNGIKLDD